MLHKAKATTARTLLQWEKASRHRKREPPKCETEVYILRTVTVENLPLFIALSAENPTKNEAKKFVKLDRDVARPF